MTLFHGGGVGGGGPCAPNPKLCTIQVVKHESGYSNANGIRRIIKRSGGFSGLQ